MWVINGPWGAQQRLPLLPCERTSLVGRTTSEKCHKLTSEGDAKIGGWRRGLYRPRRPRKRTLSGLRCGSERFWKVEAGTPACDDLMFYSN
jgi:hypothetical protein